MLSIAHTTTGALIAAALPHPALFIPVVLASHYLEDWIPHWDVGTGLSNGTRKRATAIALEIIELGISVGLVYWWWQAGRPQVQWHIWLGALTGILPDLLEAPSNFVHWEPGFFKPLNAVHQYFHYSTPNMLIGLLPQLVVVGCIWFLK